jgi:hypothetical protein
LALLAGCERQSEVSNDEVGTTPIGKPDAKTIGFWEIAAGTGSIKVPTDCAELERYAAADQQIAFKIAPAAVRLGPSQQLHACKHGVNRMLCEKGLPDFDELGVVHAALPSTSVGCFNIEKRTSLARLTRTETAIDAFATVIALCNRFAAGDAEQLWG